MNSKTASTESHRRDWTQGLTLHSAARELVQGFVGAGHDLPQFKIDALLRLSPEHPSGISAPQLETPMMKQFAAAKEELPDGLLFFRMGDFYELFGLDAILASEICQLTLTTRDKLTDNPVAMAGVPVVAGKNAFKRCVQAGFKVAVCDQVEDPRQAKGIVKREITRIATPAVPGDIDVDDDSTCYLAAVIAHGGLWSWCYADVTTGDVFASGPMDPDTFRNEFLSVSPREVLAAGTSRKALIELLGTEGLRRARLAAPDAWLTRSEPEALALFNEYFGKASFHGTGLSRVPKGLEGVTAVLAYLRQAQRGVLKNLKPVQVYLPARHLQVDVGLKQHLDFFETAGGDRKCSLFHFLNRCNSASGARLLARRMNYPFREKAQVQGQLDLVEALLGAPELASELREALRRTVDFDRHLARVASRAFDAQGLYALGQALAEIPAIQKRLAQAAAPSLAALAVAWIPACGIVPLQELLQSAIEPPVLAAKGTEAGGGARVFRAGHFPEYDALVDVETRCDETLRGIEARERETSGIANLKIGYNRVFGFYFEISKSRVTQAPAHFVRKQTLANAERFTTPELASFQEAWDRATSGREGLERELGQRLLARVLEFGPLLAECSQRCAELDVSLCFAQLAAHHSWCRPELVAARLTHLEGSVHPVLAERSGQPFIPNDISLGETTHLRSDAEIAACNARVLLITGPNMAGKSTVMRQAAIAQILCQMGCYIPARRAVLGLCDRIFTRIGSGDDALKGQSTFMVEMLETAHILRFATADSLLVVDEIGRGTSTQDGLALARAILEDVHDRLGARTLFSTHFHELAQSCQRRPEIRPMQMEVFEREQRDEQGALRREILFTRQFIQGAAGKSYGLHVAELAGLPAHVLRRAQELLEELPTRRLGGASAQTPRPQHENAFVGSRSSTRGSHLLQGASLFEYGGEG